MMLMNENVKGSWRLTQCAKVYAFIQQNVNSSLNPAHVVLEICDGEDLWQWSWLELKSKRLSLVVNHSTKTIHCHPVSPSEKSRKSEMLSIVTLMKVKDKDLHLGILPEDKALWVKWKNQEDTLGLVIKVDGKPATRRWPLSALSSGYNLVCLGTTFF